MVRLRLQLLSVTAFSVLMNLSACGGSDSGQPADTSQFNPDLPAAENTGEPGGDTTAIAGLWDGTTVVDGASDVVYWSMAANGVLTRYDYQQDGAGNATGENCYAVGEPITVTPEGGDDYSVFDVAVTAVRNADTLTITFLEADKNDLDANGDSTELPVFNWGLLTSPSLEDLNSCAADVESSGQSVGDESSITDQVAILGSDPTGDNDEFDLPIGINWSDIPQYTGDGKPYITRNECTTNGGIIVGDPGDGSVSRPGYRCASGVEPVAYITYLEGEPISIEGEVCCV